MSFTGTKVLRRVLIAVIILPCMLLIVYITKRGVPSMKGLHEIEDTATAEKILGLGCDIEKKNEDGKTALHRAAERNDLEMVRFLLANKADVNATTPEMLTPLMLVEFWGASEVTAELINHGADVNAQNSTGETAMHFAVMDESFDTVELLLKSGANPNLRNRSGESVLDYSSVHRINNLLRKHGAKAFVETDRNDPEAQGWDKPYGQ